ncbi:hypothetical protein CLV51_1011722 [Chitinophaga niastensis]|uniref:Uncharacterized protein n=1 Tax=Chitinophaga niastensis TaxID=536980 RepID=A0A2P8HVW9_CHINA|nr:hypothetical protein [Chitinophaga niastensis]PSL50377.1 hypothetical protein CLV51_1011722 [Chitinophaga niastensis]
MEVRDGKFYISISNDDPEKIINLELDNDSDTIWILNSTGELYSTTLWSILNDLETRMKDAEQSGNCITIPFD